MLAFSFVASILATAVFGLAPSLQASRAEPLRGAPGGIGRRRRDARPQTRCAMPWSSAETALSFVLLVGAGLLARSFARLQEVPLGFEPTRVLTAGMSLPRTQYSKPEQWRTFYSTLVERMKSEPGVESAAASLPLPLYGAGLNFAFKIEGRAEKPGSELSANYTALTPAYFRVLGIPLRAGDA